LVSAGSNLGGSGTANYLRCWMQAAFQ
jgi:hypothetical protein